MRWVALFLSVVALTCPSMAQEGTTAGDEDSYTLYRNSVLAPLVRIHIATFDSINGRDYNAENCNLAADLFQRQKDVQTRFWCEPGLFNVQ